MNYVDGFVLVVPKKNFSKYKKMAEAAGKVWKKHGALQYFECMGDDLSPKGIKLTFPKMTNLKPGETVWFSFITYKSKKHRDKVNKAVMREFEKDSDKYHDKPMPFDMNRIAYGGFKTIIRK